MCISQQRHDYKTKGCRDMRARSNMAIEKTGYRRVRRIAISRRRKGESYGGRHPTNLANPRVAYETSTVITGNRSIMSEKRKGALEVEGVSSYGSFKKVIDTLMHSQSPPQVRQVWNPLSEQHPQKRPQQLALPQQLGSRAEQPEQAPQSWEEPPRPSEL